MVGSGLADAPSQDELVRQKEGLASTSDRWECWCFLGGGRGGGGGGGGGPWGKWR